MGSSDCNLFFPAVGCRLTLATTSLGQKRYQKRIQKAEIAHRHLPKGEGSYGSNLNSELSRQLQESRAKGGPSNMFLEVFKSFELSTPIKEHIRYYHLQDEEDAILDISVSFDGSWLARGHKSLIGIGCVINILTGLIIAGHVLSLHCHVCAQTRAWIKREIAHRYERWRQEHMRRGSAPSTLGAAPV
ncbi:hypothetical protein PoB_004708300 [Plakobranchus ocellatus]|uniref:Mutator-like transposase domain-containing protein n=1 Tax=Plakobranchus ocellatus TaxID=259542 RepID=A0AAV4BP51_9GAST|nr:hypothetical protein PoB_004708300 [Plakobranchus ocellatus]